MELVQWQGGRQFGQTVDERIDRLYRTGRIGLLGKLTPAPGILDQAPDYFSKRGEPDFAELAAPLLGVHSDAVFGPDGELEGGQLRVFPDQLAALVEHRRSRGIAASALAAIVSLISSDLFGK